MNRQQRRAQAKATGLNAQVVQYAKSYKCPDCDSDTGEVTRDRFGVHHATILHDPTCPRLNGLTS